MPSPSPALGLQALGTAADEGPCVLAVHLLRAGPVLVSKQLSVESRQSSCKPLGCWGGLWGEGPHEVPSRQWVLGCFLCQPVLGAVWCSPTNPAGRPGGWAWVSVPWDADCRYEALKGWPVGGRQARGLPRWRSTRGWSVRVSPGCTYSSKANLSPPPACLGVSPALPTLDSGPLPPTLPDSCIRFHGAGKNSERRLFLLVQLPS